MHHPEAPEVIHYESFARARKQPYRVEGGNRESGVKEHPRHIAEVLLAQGPAEAAKQDEDPQKKTNDEQDLPQPAQIEIFPTLMAKPKP